MSWLHDRTDALLSGQYMIHSPEVVYSIANFMHTGRTQCADAEGRGGGDDLLFTAKLVFLKNFAHILRDPTQIELEVIYRL